MDCKAQNAALAQKCAQQLANESDPIERFKLYALKSGAAGIKNVGRKFRIMDDSGDRKLSFDEFLKGCRECSQLSKMTDEDLKAVFNYFDKDKSGCLDFNEFLLSIQPRMNEGRKKLVLKAYAVLDKTGDQRITIDDITGKYNVKKHPKYANGSMTENEILKEFLKCFEPEEHKDGVVTPDEWIAYYAGLSASIDDDNYFALMMYNSWGVKSTD